MISTIKTPENICIICNTPLQNKIASAKDHEYKSSNIEYSFFKCDNCSSVRIFPYPTKEELQKAYPENYYSFHLSNNYLKYKDTYWGKIFYKSYFSYTKDCLKTWSQTVGKQISDLKILDYGSGDGFKLKILNDVGVLKDNLYGYDPYNKNINFNEITDITNTDKSFDIIIANHVIEHIESPKILFKTCKNILLKNGIIVIEMPTPKGIHFKLTSHKHWGGYHAPRHLNILTLEALETVATAEGYKVIQKTYVDDSWIMAQTLNSLLTAIPNRLIPNFIKNSIFVETKEKPTFSRALIFKLLSIASKVLSKFDGKSSVCIVILKRC